MASELNPFDKLQCKHEQKHLLVTITVVIIVTAISLVVNSSFKSKWIPIKVDNVLNGQKTTTFPKKDRIAISYFRRHENEKFSKFVCSGSENNIQMWPDRLCIFYDICYNRDTDHFYYFRSAQRKPKPLFYDSAKGMLFQFSESNDGVGFLSLSADGNAPWAPVIINTSYPERNFTRLHQLHSLTKYRFAEGNIGHGLWEDLGSISYSMDRMNVADRKLVIMYLGEVANTTLSELYHQYVIPALTENPMVEFGTYAQSFNTTYICFDNLMVGGQLLALLSERIRENHGREALFYNWRSKIIQYNGFDPKFVPKIHHIIITNKSQSLWTHGSTSRHRAIVNLKEVEEFIKLTYPTISTEVVEWHTVPFNKQLEKLVNTTILITPCGGVSFVIPFLPHGAHAIVMDYYVNVEGFGFQSGQSGSMDGAFFNHIPHVRMQYYQIYGSEDYEFDYQGATDARESSSIIVNMTRLQLLVDAALEDMEP